MSDDDYELMWIGQRLVLQNIAELSYSLCCFQVMSVVNIWAGKGSFTLQASNASGALDV